MTFFPEIEKGFYCYYNNNKKPISFDELIFELDMTHDSKYVFVTRYNDVDQLILDHNINDKDCLGSIKFTDYHSVDVYYYDSFINSLKSLNPESDTKIRGMFLEYHTNNGIKGNNILRINGRYRATNIGVIYRNIVLTTVCIEFNVPYQRPILYHIKPEYKDEIISYVKQEYKKYE